jgi:hypothetical protein
MCSPFAAVSQTLSPEKTERKRRKQHTSGVEHRRVYGLRHTLCQLRDRGRVSQIHVWPRDQRKHVRLRFDIEQELEANPALRGGEGDLASEKL